MQAIEGQYRSIIEATEDAIIVVDKQNQVLFTNSAIKKIQSQLTTHTKQNLLSLNYTTDPTSEEVKIIPLKQSYLLSIATSNQHAEIYLQASNSKLIPMEIRVSEIEWSNKDAFLIILHDLSDHKKINELSAKINEQERIDQLKDEFIGIVSHEMRTPLTIIKGAISNLQAGIAGPLNDKQQKVLGTSSRNIIRLARIINDLLDLSRLESGRAKMLRKKISPLDLIHDIQTNFTAEIEDKQIEFIIDVPHDIPEVFADSDMIIQVLNNLINNAIRYTKKTITISAHLASDTKYKSTLGDNAIIFSVEDDGIGIESKNLKSLFNKFEQINRKVGGSGYKGTGLGLAICKEIIALHHSKIWASIETQSGAKLCFSLPVYQENDEFYTVLKTYLLQAKEHRKPLTVLAVGIANISSIIKDCEIEDIHWMLNDILKEVRSKALRKNDLIYFQKETQELIIVLNEISRKESLNIVKRIHNLTKDCFCPGKQGKIYASLNIGIATYPVDSKDAKELVKFALNDIR
jgi:PAS domain S-box-containing protein